MSNLKKKIPTTNKPSVSKSTSSKGTQAKSTQAPSKEPALITLGDLARARLYTYELNAEQQNNKISGIASIIQRLIATPFLALSEMGSSAAEITFDFEENEEGKCKYTVQSADDCGPVFDGDLSERDVNALKTLTPGMCENLGLFLTIIWKAKVAVQRVSEDDISEAEEMEEDEVEEEEGNEEDGSEDIDEEDIELDDDDDEGFNINDGIVLAINLF